jgi:hypothetical protein
MTDRFSTLTVALEADIREDDAQALIAAIKQLRGVADVTGSGVGDVAQWLAETRVRRELGQKILDVVFPRPACSQEQPR